MALAKITKSFQYGKHTVTLETGEIARQASGACVASMGDTVVLATAVTMKEPMPGKDFFPMTVDYQEKTFAAGRIPGGFFKREGRPSEKEILTSRLIDRPIRPLFPEGFTNEVQIIVTVISVDPDIDPDIVAMLGASAALKLSGAPFNGPIGAVRVGYQDGQYLLNPGNKELVDSKLNLVVAGTAKAVLMVESEAQELSEEVMLGAVVFGHEQMQVAIKSINELVEEAGVQAWAWQPPVEDSALKNALQTEFGPLIAEAYRIKEKGARQDRVAEVETETHQQRRHTVGQHLKKQNAPVGLAGHARRLHILFLLLRHHHAADDARIGRNRIDAERDIERIKPAAEGGDQRDRQEPAGKGDDRVHDAHQCRVHPAAGEAGDRADRNAEEGAEKDRADGDLKRRARAEHDAAISIPAEVVGAEPMIGAGAFEALGDVNFIGVVGGHEGSEQRGYEPDPDDHDAEQRQAIARNHLAGAEKSLHGRVRAVGGGPGCWQCFWFHLGVRYSSLIRGSSHLYAMSTIRLMNT